MFRNEETMVLDDPMPGFYQVSLTAADSHENGQTAKVSFEIAPLRIPDGDAPVLDGHCGDAAYQDGISVDIPLKNGGQAYVRLILAKNHLFACFYDLKRIVQDVFRSIPTIAGLQVDSDGNGGIVGGSDDRGFFVDENSVPFQRDGDPNGMIITTLSRQLHARFREKQGE